MFGAVLETTSPRFVLLLLDDFELTASLVAGKFGSFQSDGMGCFPLLLDCDLLLKALVRFFKDCHTLFFLLVLATAGGDAVSWVDLTDDPCELCCLLSFDTSA